PSASRLIADLERSLGFRLFVRSGRGLVPTPEARQFYRAVDSMYVGMDRLQQAAEAIRISGQDILSLGMIAVFTHSNVMAAVRDVYHSRPALRIAVSVRTNQDIIHAVRLQQLDIGVVSTLHAIDELHTIACANIPYVCLLPLGHRMAKARGPIDIQALDQDEIVALPNEYLATDNNNSQVLDSLLQNARLQSHSMPAVASLARFTGAVALVDQFSASVAVSLGGVVRRPLKQQLSLPVAVVCHATDTLTEAGHGLAHSLGSYLASVV
ncbi:MAG: LysR family transcriptional regulator, partial [Burkholderiaceae bacterium]